MFLVGRALLDLDLFLSFPFLGFRPLPIEADLDLLLCFQNLTLRLISGVLSDPDEVFPVLLASVVALSDKEACDVWKSEECAVLDVSSVGTIAGIVASFVWLVSADEGQAGNSQCHFIF